MHAPDARPAPPVSRRALRRAVLGASVGHFVEWYDYGIYGYLAGSLALVFFPSEDPTVSLLAAYSVFAASFIVRPFSGVLFGSLGDRLGRKYILSVTVLLISGATVLIGLLPGYAAIGIAAPALLLALRLVQGASAGGEVGGAVAVLAEYAPDRRRGFIVGFGSIGSPLGSLFGSSLVMVLVTTLGQNAVDEWAWRIPFLVAGPLGLVGLFLRLRLDETPLFREQQESGKTEKSPLRDALRNHKTAILRCAGLAVTHHVPYYLILAYLPNYLAAGGNLPVWGAYLAVSVALITKIVTVPFTTTLADRVGRRPVIAASALGYALLAYPLFTWMSSEGLAVVLICQAILGILFAGFSSSAAAVWAELFPTSVRYSSISIGYNLAAALFGGTAPFIATWLVASTGNESSPAFYLIGGALISLIAIVTTHETAGSSLATAGSGAYSRRPA